MELPVNHFKAALQAGKQQIGIWCSIPGSGHAEALAGCGFDWMLIDTEHTAVDHATVMAMLQAVAPYSTRPVVRPGWNDPVEIKRLLDIGAQTLLVPYVQTADEACQAVSAVRYPPRGMRGLAGITRASRYGAIPSYHARADAEICLLVQAETVATLDRLEAIAAVDGVDGIFVGPSDLAASMGLPGQPSHPEVKKAALDAVRRIVASGKAAGVLSPDQEFLRELVAAGTTFTAVGADAGVLLQGARALAKAWKP